jgi:hypothetical protein
MSEKNLSEKIESFQQDLNKLLDKYGFTDLYREIINDTCVKDARQQISKKQAIASYEKNK